MWILCQVSMHLQELTICHLFVLMFFLNLEKTEITFSNISVIWELICHTYGYKKTKSYSQSIIIIVIITNLYFIKVEIVTVSKRFKYKNTKCDKFFIN